MRMLMAVDLSRVGGDPPRCLTDGVLGTGQVQANGMAARPLHRWIYKPRQLAVWTAKGNRPSVVLRRIDVKSRIMSCPTWDLSGTAPALPSGRVGPVPR